MATAGRGKLLVAITMMGAVCLAGLGCQADGRYTFFKPPQSMFVNGPNGYQSQSMLVQKPNAGAIPGQTNYAGQGGASGVTRASVPPARPAQGVQRVGYEEPAQPEAANSNAPIPVPSVDGIPGTAQPLPVGPVANGQQPVVSSLAAPVEIAASPTLPLPTELNKVNLPPYIIEPPDVLLLDAVRLVPRPPYHIDPLDTLLVNVTETLPNQPIAGVYAVGPEGNVGLGFSYGAVRVVGLTIAQAEEAIRKHLSRILKNPQVAVGLSSFRGVQQTRGEHLVRPDGTISLGTYGSVNVTGLTLAQAKVKIEAHLSQYLLDPEISLDVVGYNSKGYYVITDGAGFGQQVYKFPITGNETVLDAIEHINGLPAVSSRRKMWVARPAPCGHGCVQVLPVDWQAIVQGGATCTNYQLFPGDRIYVKADSLITLDNTMAKIIAPIERMLGITLLTGSNIRTFNNLNTTTGVGVITTGF